MKDKIIVIAGPTTSRKTEISINLAKKINGEIISADSMQVYKHMDIGTAKVKEYEMQDVPHYLIDEILPNESYSVAQFKYKADSYIKYILNKNKVPIIVGGTGFYINALVYNNNFIKIEKNLIYRQELEIALKEKGSKYLHNQLKKVDSESSLLIHENNSVRIMRALEFYKETGLKISEHNKLEKKRQFFYDVKFNILNMERKLLYNRIDDRVELMFNDGLVDEVKFLLNIGYNENLPSMKSIGYKETIMYLKNMITLDEAKDLIKMNTRRFAKRQITWFKNQTDGHWVDTNQELDCILNDLSL